MGVVNAWLHPFHRVRVCDGDCVPVTLPDQRPTVDAAARAWYEQAKAAYGKAHGEGPVPMLIVATAGGGIRAAYWTATVLEKLEKRFQGPRSGVRPYLFAISGVSGGSVGATAFEAALAKRDESQMPARRRDVRSHGIPERGFPRARARELDFHGTPSSFLPDFGQDDRGAALERSFEQASDGLLGTTLPELLSARTQPRMRNRRLGVRSFCSTPRMRKPASGSSPAMS